MCFIADATSFDSVVIQKNKTKNIQPQFHFEATSPLHDCFIILTEGRVTRATLSPLKLQTKPTTYNLIQCREGPCALQNGKAETATSVLQTAFFTIRSETND